MKDLPQSTWQVITGYSEAHKSRCEVFFPRSVDDCRAVLEYAKSKNKTVCPRGMGLSYGESALNEGHIVLETSQLNKFLKWDFETGVVSAEPGVTISELLEKCHSTGWLFPACPGVPGLTLGGAVSNNIHGKDNWKQGNISQWIRSVTLLSADGELKTVTVATNPELFFAVIGGQGLLGVVVEITLQLLRCESLFVESEVVPAKNLKEGLKILDESSTDSDFLVYWLDAFAKSGNLGRGFIKRARWIRSQERLSNQTIKKLLKVPKRCLWVLPYSWLWRLLRPFWGRTSCKILNQILYYKNQRIGRSGIRKSLPFLQFNFMHRSIPGFREVYRPFGFLEIQPLIPKDRAETALSELLEFCQKHKCESLLCAVKCHKKDPCLLSFSGEGFSIGIDFHLRGRSDLEIDQIVTGIQEIVCKYSGKIYLAKNERLSSRQFERMYPRLKEFLLQKVKEDPHQLFSSNWFRRIYGY